MKMTDIRRSLFANDRMSRVANDPIMRITILIVLIIIEYSVKGGCMCITLFHFTKSHR